MIEKYSKKAWNEKSMYPVLKLNTLTGTINEILH